MKDPVQPRTSPRARLRLPCLLGMAGLWTLLVLLDASNAHALGFGFETLPVGGQIVASPGETVGWGYRISNPALDRWLVPTSLDAGAFADGAPDASPFDFPIVAPGASIEVTYDGSSGLFAFTWSTLAPPGFSNEGVFTLAADWYDGDPFAGGTFLEPASDTSAPYRVSVAPEAGTGVLVALGTSVLVMARRG